MGEHLEIFLLGRVLLRFNGEPIRAITSHKALALFIYLACHPEPISRDRLADLLYSTLPQQRARADLSVLLNRLQPLAAYLHPTRHSVAFNPQAAYWLDTQAMTAQLKPLVVSTTAAETLSPAAVSSLKTTLELYQGDFLAGFHLPDALGFEEWVVVEQERLHQLVLIGLERLVGYYLASGQYQAGLEPATRLLQLDPLHETGHRHMMTLLARTGQRAEALAHYHRCRHILAQELGAEPSPEIAALYQRIRETKGPPHHNLPALSTSFVGREHELNQIARRLQSPACRLLSLIGPGGIGKTRLALEAARQQASNFWQGLCYVPLATIDSVDRLVVAIAKALNLILVSLKEPKIQLLHHLQNKELLLILDGFEHLLSTKVGWSEGTALLVDILQTAPNVKILLTSRERLNLNGEWVLLLSGLPTPVSTSLTALAGSAAAQLLLERGRQVHPGLHLTEIDAPAVAQLCRLVGGMPLAIELAAGWLKLLTFTEIQTEIAQSLDFLATRQEDVPERQRTMRAVFEYSWRSLNDLERMAARQLSIFQGGFRREAAAAILSWPATQHRNQPGSLPSVEVLNLLSQLVDRSFLQVTQTGRYEQHLLVKQFAAEKLAERPEEQAQTKAWHGRYFAAFLDQCETRLWGTGQSEAFAEINEEMPNIRFAWQRAIAGQRVTEIGLCLTSLLLYYLNQYWHQEAEAVFGQAVEALLPLLDRTVIETDPDEKVARDRELRYVLSLALVCQAEFTLHLGHLEQAQGLAARSLELSRPLGAYRPIIVALNQLGLIAVIQSQIGPAKRFFDEALLLAETNGDNWLRAETLGCLGMCVRRQDQRAAAGYYQASADLFRELGDQRALTASLFGLAIMTRRIGSLAEARVILEEGLAIARKADYQVPLVWYLVGLGELVLATREYRLAFSCLEECLTIARQLGFNLGAIPDLADLNNPVEALSDCPAATDAFNEAITLALELQFPPRVLAPLVRLARWLLHPDRHEKVEQNE